MSRAHTGKSEKFKTKRATRRQREYNRKVLRVAQTMYRQRYGCPNIKNIDMDRNIIISIKKEIISDKLIDKDDLDFSL